MPLRKLVECVPNFSEGKNRKVIDSLADAISSVHGVMLLDVDIGYGANRTVYTYAGEPDPVREAAFRAARSAFESIDMRVQKGVHPRIGALDVCPFVPLAGSTMEDCVDCALRFGKRLGEELDVPVYLYEAAAKGAERESLSAIRSGEYEGLLQKLADPFWRPDFGPAAFRPRWGASAVGAREFLIAYNVNLDTKDLRLAKEISLRIREKGRAARDLAGKFLKNDKGEILRHPGRLRKVRAIGWYIEEYGLAQVSTNILDFMESPIQKVYETIKDEAEKLGVRVKGSEIIGLIPLEAILSAGRFYAETSMHGRKLDEKGLIRLAVRSLGLGFLSPFDEERKIVEYAVRNK